MPRNIPSHLNDIIALEIDVVIRAGRNLKAMDRSLFGKKSSDPYIIISHGRSGPLGKTQVIKKNLNPEWNCTLKLHITSTMLNWSQDLVFAVFDKDKRSSDDPMGEVRFPIQTLVGARPAPSPGKWFPVRPGRSGCKKAKGDLHLDITVLPRHCLKLKRRDKFALGGGVIGVGMGWDGMPGATAVDLDTSCVAMDRRGNVDMAETVYYGNLSNRNRSVTHSGDEREGDEDLNAAGDDEVITVNLAYVPQHIIALFFIGTVASPDKTFRDVKTARMRVFDARTGNEMCRVVPAVQGAHTASFLARVARVGNTGRWELIMIGDADHTARDFGTLVPEIKMYLRDLVPGIRYSPTDRVAVMRKGGEVRLSNYSRNVTTSPMLFGLAWDVTDGVEIDLDASVIMLDARLTPVDTVFYGKLKSNDGSVVHQGDEREGDEKGDDEKILLHLGRVHPAVQYLGIVITSYSGQELDDVKDCGCHLCDYATGMDVAKYTLTNTKELDKKTMLLVSVLYRNPENASDWCMRIVSQPGIGIVASKCIPALQRHLQQKPCRPLPIRKTRATAHMNISTIPVATAAPAVATANAARMGLAAVSAFGGAGFRQQQQAQARAVAMPVVQQPQQIALVGAGGGATAFPMANAMPVMAQASAPPIPPLPPTVAVAAAAPAAAAFPPPAAAAAGGGGGGMMAQLQQLMAMKQSGLLTDAEFGAAKARLLGTAGATAARAVM